MQGATAPDDRLGGPVEPRLSDHLALRPLRGGELRLDGGFWGERQLRNREVTIPHGIEMLSEWGPLDNLRAAARRGDKEYQLPLFMDSDVYKLVEAIAWERQHGLVQEQEHFFAEVVGLLSRAQEPDGYINSYVQVVQAGKRFSDPAMGHELYCAGHLFQAVVAEARSGPAPGGRTLAEVADRFAGYLLATVPGMPNYLDGHAEIEMALVELYRLRGQGPLLALAEDLIGRRGRSNLNWGSFHPDYFQDDIPVVGAKVVRGHAVRALYLMSGVTDAYLETGRHDLLEACLAQWDDMVSGKAYLTGGLGSRHEGEAFGESYELPSDRAYCETCAAIASIMWNWRMTLATGEARFAELLERTLYNAFLAGWGLDGKSFFYVNPLQSRGDTSRQRWYRCACCPPNLMRLLASLEHYVATSTLDGLQLHQFMPASIDAELAGERLRARVETKYPYEGSVVVVVEEASGANMEIAFRLPSWSQQPVFAVNGISQSAEVGPDGYLRARRAWRRGDEVSLELHMPPRVVRPDGRIDALRGCFALERGPFVYCFEGTGQDTTAHDGGTSLDGLYGAPGDGLSELALRVASEDTVGLVVPARKAQRSSGTGWPYKDGAASGAYESPKVDLTAIPYYAWCNRGPTEMRVWLPELRAPAN